MEHPWVGLKVVAVMNLLEPSGFALRNPIVRRGDELPYLIRDVDAEPVPNIRIPLEEFAENVREGTILRYHAEPAKTGWVMIVATRDYLDRLEYAHVADGFAWLRDGGMSVAYRPRALVLEWMHRSARMLAKVAARRLGRLVRREPAAYGYQHVEELLFASYYPCAHLGDIAKPIERDVHVLHAALLKRFEYARLEKIGKDIAKDAGYDLKTLLDKADDRLKKLERTPRR